MSYIPDDVSQLPGNHPACIPVSRSRHERVTILLHKKLDQVIDLEHQPTLHNIERRRLAAIHQQLRNDIQVIKYGASEQTIRDIERKYSGK